MSRETPLLTIKDFQNGVADSPHLGIGLMRNLNIEAFPGAVTVSMQPAASILIVPTQTFTANAGTDICTAAGTISASFFTYAAVQFSTTGTLPAGLSPSTTYFLIKVTNSTFRVATSWANADSGTYIDITDAGTGVHTMTPISPGTIKWIVKDPRSSYYYALDSLGQVWHARGLPSFYLLTGNSTTNASGNGLALFATSDASATYLFVFRNAKIDVINVFGDSNLNSPSWTTNWQSLNTTAGSSTEHYALVGQDNIIYACDTRYIASIQEKAGQVFDPSNSATYTYNNQALALPQNEVAKCLAEQGINLLIGGLSFNKIYPWDRNAISYNLPLLVPEIGIYRMVNLGNQVFVFAGQKGNVYTSQGTYVKFFKKIPEYISNNVATTISTNFVTWGDARIKNGAVVFGMTCASTANAGAYVLYPDGRLIQDNTPMTLGNVTALYAENDFYLMGYASNLDVMGAVRYSNYEGVLQSQLYMLASKTQKTIASQLEIQLAQKNTSAHFRVKYRTDEGSSFVDFPTAVSGTTDSSTLSYNFDIGLIDIENIQVQVEMDGNIRLAEIRFFK